MNFKRHRPRRWVRCVMCTPNRNGNSRKGYSGVKARDRRETQIDGLTSERFEPLVLEEPPPAEWWPEKWDDPFEYAFDTSAGYEEYRRVWLKESE